MQNKNKLKISNNLVIDFLRNCKFKIKNKKTKLIFYIYCNEIFIDCMYDIFSCTTLNIIFCNYLQDYLLEKLQFSLEFYSLDIIWNFNDYDNFE